MGRRNERSRLLSSFANGKIRGIFKKSLPVSSLSNAWTAVFVRKLWLEHSIAGSASGFDERKNVPRLTPRENGYRQSDL